MCTETQIREALENNQNDNKRVGISTKSCNLILKSLSETVFYQFDVTFSLRLSGVECHEISFLSQDFL